MPKLPRRSDAPSRVTVPDVALGEPGSRSPDPERPPFLTVSAATALAARRVSPALLPPWEPAHWSQALTAAVEANPDQGWGVGLIGIDLSMSQEKKFDLIREGIGSVRADLVKDQRLCQRLMAALAFVNLPPVLRPFSLVTEDELWPLRFGNCSPVFLTLKQMLERAAANRDELHRRGIEVRRNVVELLTDADVNEESETEQEENINACIDLQRDDPDLEVVIYLTGDRANLDAAKKLVLNPDEQVRDYRNVPVEKLIQAVVGSLRWVSMPSTGKRIDLSEVARHYGIEGFKDV